VTERPEVVLADAGYWSNAHIDALRARGVIPIVAPDTTRRRPRKTRLGGPYDFMRRVLATEHGGELYARRLGMVEPVFGQIKANRRIDRFKRRGRAAARSEWRLIAATHNLLSSTDSRGPPQRHEAGAERPRGILIALASPPSSTSVRAFVRQPHVNAEVPVAQWAAAGQKGRARQSTGLVHAGKLVERGTNLVVIPVGLVK